MDWREFTADNPVMRHRVEKEFTWMRRYAFYYFLRSLHNTETAEDCTHSLLEQFIHRLSLKTTLNRAYFKKMARYFLIDYLRKGKKELGHLSLENPCDGDGVPQELDMAAGALNSIYAHVLESFTQEKQRVIQQRVLGFTAREIAEDMRGDAAAITPNHIGVIFHDFKKRMREKLQSNDLESGPGENR